LLSSAPFDIKQVGSIVPVRWTVNDSYSLIRVWKLRIEYYIW
jgi:hypothetical protein